MAVLNLNLKYITLSCINHDREWQKAEKNIGKEVIRVGGRWDGKSEPNLGLFLLEKIRWYLSGNRRC